MVYRKIPRNMSATTNSVTPNVGVSALRTEGATIRCFSSHSPASSTIAIDRKIHGVIFGFRPIRPANGTTKHITIKSADHLPQGSSARWMIQICSQGNFPYQMTRYWAKNR